MRALKAEGLRVLVHVGALLPVTLLLWDHTQNRLTANPIEAATLRTGRVALVLLVLWLACTPLGTVLGLRPLLRLRRALGLYAFAYAALHFSIFVGLDYGFDPVMIREALFEKRYALAGLAAFLLLVPAAITSTEGWRKRLGRRWKRLQQLAYLAAPLAVVHYLWLAKADVRAPLQYGAVVMLLLLLRLPMAREAAARRQRRPGE